MSAPMPGVYSGAHLLPEAGSMVKRVSRGRIAAGAAAVACLLACRKKGDPTGEAEPAGAKEGRAGAARLAAPVGLFAHIPADTPYVFASFGAAPASIWDRFAPMMEEALAQLPPPDPAATPAERFD